MSKGLRILQAREEYFFLTDVISEAKFVTVCDFEKPCFSVNKKATVTQRKGHDNSYSMFWGEILNPVNFGEGFISVC